jgi:hypothetical protein
MLAALAELLKDPKAGTVIILLAVIAYGVPMLFIDRSIARIEAAFGRFVETFEQCHRPQLSQR